MEVNTKMKLDDFTGMMTGHFDNKEQFDKMQAEGKTYPYAEHVNTICNDKIKNLPEDFNDRFVVEESYYETNGKRHASPHLFLITETEQGILLSSYEIPEGEDKKTFSYASMKKVDYAELKKSEKFTPALYHEKNGIWEGGSISQFSPVMIFKLLDMMNQSFIKGYNQRAADEEIILHQYSRNLIFDVLERAGDGYGTFGKIWYAIKNTEISLMESKK